MSCVRPELDGAAAWCAGVLIACSQGETTAHAVLLAAVQYIYHPPPLTPIAPSAGVLPPLTISLVLCWCLLRTKAAWSIIRCHALG